MGGGNMAKKMRRFSAAFFIGITVALLLLSLPQAEAKGTVDEITASVTSVAPIPSLVRQRMETTVAAIGTQLLAGRHVSDVETARAQEEAIIHEVFDKVLVGYSVESVALTPGEISRIEIRLAPWADVIRAVKVDVTVEGMPPLVEEMARRDLADVGSVFGEGMQGLPVAASDWTNGVLKRSLQQYMDEHLPEFRADFDVVPGDETRVALTVYPRLPVVRTVDLSMRSESIPNFTLLAHRQQMQDNVNLLIGVPVAFVERHEAELCGFFASSLDANSDFRALDLHTAVTMKPGRDMSVMSRSDTKKYLIRLEGWADISHKDNDGRNTVFRFHAGKRISPKDELFAQIDIAPQDVKWTWQLGYARHLADTTRLLVRYDMRDKKFILGGEQELGRRWMLRYEYRWTDQMGEGAIRYRLHDFLSLEYVMDKKDKWLRVIGNF